MAGQLLRTLVGAIRHGVLQETQRSTTLDPALSDLEGPSAEEPTPRVISDLCAAAAGVSKDCLSADVWKETERNLLAASAELSKVWRALQAESLVLDTSDELEMLAVLSKARVHLGMGLGLVLCPSPVDPVTMAMAEYIFHSQLVSS